MRMYKVLLLKNSCTTVRRRWNPIMNLSVGFRYLLYQVLCQSDISSVFHIGNFVLDHRRGLDHRFIKPGRLQDCTQLRS